MSEIKWESDFKKALESAEKSRKPVYLDFWFDG